MDKQIEWLCKNVSSFESAYLQAEKARTETAAYRAKYADCDRVVGQRMKEAES